MTCNPDDVIRDAILRHLYEVHRNGKGRDSGAIGIRDLQSALKKSHGYKQKEVASNLDYLVQKQWVAEVIRERSFTTKQGTRQPSTSVKYKISHVGIDKLQKASLYERTPMSSGINITNVNGVTVVGDGNVVNTGFTDLDRVLADLRAGIEASPDVTDTDKLNAVADIDTLQAQLQKPEPNRTVVGTLWTGIETVAEKAKPLLGLVQKAAEFIAPLLP